ncbi:MAG TPA: nucleotidyltransferase domain-containing protein [Thermomicrobiales bacterium]|nr:nucleotidyltransferase domain-containing protein [Thermomicrobiales bacterium]
MLPQETLIARVREVCRADDRLVAAMMYGSFARGEGDAFSDVEFILFFADDLLPALDQRAWVAQIAPVALNFVNEFGIGTAIFDTFIRGEFHFDRASDIAKVDESWRSTDWFPSLDATLVLDRTGELTRRLAALIGPPPARDAPEQIRFLADSLVNWLLFGSNVLARGELARALDLLGHAQRYLLWLARLATGATEHWPTPSKSLEGDLPAAAYARYAACTAPLDAAALRAAYRAACAWGAELLGALSAQYGLALPVELLGRVGAPSPPDPLSQRWERGSGQEQRR